MSITPDSLYAIKLLVKVNWYLLNSHKMLLMQKGCLLFLFVRCFFFNW